MVETVKFDPGMGDLVVDFTNAKSPEFFENIAMCSEKLMEEYL